MRAQRETIRMGMDGNYENYENGEWMMERYRKRQSHGVLPLDMETEFV